MNSMKRQKTGHQKMSLAGWKVSNMLMEKSEGQLLLLLLLLSRFSHFRLCATP